MYRSKQARLHARGLPGGWLIKINGRQRNIYFARKVYRCAVCHCKLEIRETGLECLADETHRGFIHRDEAKKLQAQANEQTNEIKAAYEIVNGQIVVKEQ